MSINARAAIARAQREVQEEAMESAVERLKTKLHARMRAQLVLENIDRDIASLERNIEEGLRHE